MKKISDLQQTFLSIVEIGLKNGLLIIHQLYELGTTG
jgi:hypothetical protein